MANYHYDTVEPSPEARGFVSKAVELFGEKEALRQKMKMIDAELSLIKEVLLEDVGRNRLHLLAETGHRITLGFRREVDRDAVREDYPHDEHPYLYSHSPSGAMIQSVLPEEESSKYVTERVSISWRKPDDPSLDMRV